MRFCCSFCMVEGAITLSAAPRGRDRGSYGMENHNAPSEPWRVGQEGHSLNH